MEFAIIKINSNLWNSLWDELEQHPINENIENPSLACNDGFCWEYVGSYLHKNRLISEFLHKYHPATNNWYKMSLVRNLTDLNDIEKTIKI